MSFSLTPSYKLDLSCLCVGGTSRLRSEPMNWNLWSFYTSVKTTEAKVVELLSAFPLTWENKKWKYIWKWFKYLDSFCVFFQLFSHNVNWNKWQIKIMFYFSLKTSVCFMELKNYLWSFSDNWSIRLIDCENNIVHISIQPSLTHVVWHISDDNTRILFTMKFLLKTWAKVHKPFLFQIKKRSLKTSHWINYTGEKTQKPNNQTTWGGSAQKRCSVVTSSYSNPSSSSPGGGVVRETGGAFSAVLIILLMIRNDHDILFSN